MSLQGLVTNKNHFISTSRVSMATKFGRMVTYLDGLLPIRSYNSVILWSCSIVWQTETIISPIQQSLWPQNLVRWWLTGPFGQMISSNHHKHDKLKPFNLHYFDHQTWHIGNISWLSLIVIVTWPFNNMVLLDHVPHWKHISTITISMAIKRGKVVKCYSELPLITLLHPSIVWLVWSCDMFGCS